MQTLLEHLERSRIAFHAEVAGLSADQYAARRSTEVWSIMDVVEHIATVEIGVLEVFRTRLFERPCPPKYQAQTGGKDQIIVDAMRDRMTRRVSPDLVKPAGRWPHAMAALAAFEQARQGMIDLLKKETRDLRDYCAPHPSLKALDGYQWILFLATHTDRHRIQISELKAVRASAS
jgi:hypothetical protein